MSHLNIRTIFVTSLVALSLSACQTTGSGPSNEVSYTQITKLSAFQGGVVGKTLRKDSNHVVITDKGTWSGVWDGKKIGGDWVWEDGAFCRTMNDAPRDCQLFEMSNKFNQLRVTRNRGSGRSWNYQIEK